eukprot:8222166-Alexandrium_andersonii.AAC.1
MDLLQELTELKNSFTLDPVAVETDEASKYLMDKAFLKDMSALLVLCRAESVSVNVLAKKLNELQNSEAEELSPIAKFLLEHE